MAIMYVCAYCAEHNPEGCGHYDANELRVVPDGTWLCEECFDEMDARGIGVTDDEAEKPLWLDLKPPPEHVPLLMGE